MRLKEYNKMIEDTVRLFGKDTTVHKGIESCAELIDVLTHFGQVDISDLEVAEKIAAVRMACDQLIVVFGNKRAASNYKTQKSKQLKQSVYGNKDPQ